MTRYPRPDADTADRLLTGRLAPDDAPPGYSQVAALLSSAAAPDRTADPSQLRELVDAVRSTRPASDSRRQAMLGKILTLKAAVAAGVLTLGVATAGAVTGTLPTTVQNTAHDVFSHAGVSIPGGDEVTTKDDGPTPADVVSNSDDNSQDEPGVAPVSPPPVTDQSGDHQGDEPGNQVQAPAPDQTSNPPADQGNDNSQGDNNNQGDNNQGDQVSTPPPSDQGAPPPADQGSQNDQGSSGSSGTSGSQDQQGNSQN